jgi:nucleoside-triphosphatase
MVRHVLLTGPPGCGKTTVIRRVADGLTTSGASVRGFWTEEVREGGTRTGFGVEAVSGRTGALARVGLTSPYRVGRYGVDLAAFESVGVAEIEAALTDAAARRQTVLVIDEIGKMELFSERFRRAVQRSFTELPHVVATIMQRSHRVADALKSRSDVRLLAVTAQNRDDLPAQILSLVLSAPPAPPRRPL